MEAKRAEKSGFARETQSKINSKWDEERAVVAINWIGERIGEPLSPNGSIDNSHDILGDGLVLGKLANWVKPGKIPQSKLNKPSPMAFKKMELIGNFLEVIGEFVRKDELFQTVDLYEKQNMVQVILTIEALGRSLLSKGREGFGIVESKGEKREFTEEQMRAGQNVIGLQMGSNKGASQSGQNFGKTRAIMD